MIAVLLKESWSYVEDRLDDLANSFYARVFLADPNLRELFPIDMSGQRSRLIEGLYAAMQVIDDPERFDQMMIGLGRVHHRFHVEPEHYGIIGTALISALREYAGAHWTIEYDQAWRDAYDAMASRMLIGAEQARRLPSAWPAEIISHERRGRDVAVIRCQPLHPLSFHAGQYVQVECPYHRREWRPYSIGNAPRPDGTVEFHVRAREGWVSAALVRRCKVGDVLRLGPPVGTMTVDHASTRDVVGVAGGTGLAGIKSIVEELAGRRHNRWMHVFFGARSRDELYGLPELTQLATKHPWLSVVCACSDDPSYSGELGPVSEVMSRYGPWPDHEFFICGAPPMVRATLTELAQLHTPRALIRYDALTTY